MGAVVAGDEVEVLDRRGIEGCHEGRPSGVGNGSWGETFFKVGIIGRFFLEVSLSQIPVEVWNAVDDGGITAQGYAAFQAIMEDGGDQGALLGNAGLLFDDGGKDNDLAIRHAQFRCPTGKILSIDPPEFSHHGLDDVARGNPFGQEIGVRKEISLNAFFLNA
jgi:hypothetical protein